MISTMILPSGTEGSFVDNSVSEPRPRSPLAKTYSTLVESGSSNETFTGCVRSYSGAANDERETHSSILPSEDLGKGIKETASV